MTQTFAEMGIPFPLFHAPSEFASEYVGIDCCSLCETGSRHCFRVDIGGAIVVSCARCETDNALDASNRVGGVCVNCETKILFPVESDDVLCCYECLRSGRVALTKDTELGMISWEQAIQGVTHGSPELRHADFEMVPRTEGWIGARVDRSVMFELLRTPTFNTWQGENWLFCCGGPMIYLGEWNRDDFDSHSPGGDGRKLFLDIVLHPNWAIADREDYIGEASVYVFRCQQCKNLKAYCDIS